MAIDFGGTLYAWNSARVIASFVVAAFALLCPRCSSCLASQRLSRSDFFQYNSSRTKKPCSSSYSVQHRTRGVILNLFMYRYSSICIRGDDALKAAVRLLLLVLLYTLPVISNGERWYYFVRL